MSNVSRALCKYMGQIAQRRPERPITGLSALELFLRALDNVPEKVGCQLRVGTVHYTVSSSYSATRLPCIFLELVQSKKKKQHTVSFTVLPAGLAQPLRS